ncbi:MAG: VPLPA-CTERM-specific exosortase XrtD [Alphaproteobacteria bacterium]|nr:VPLPA-CTERM-specific exosortase XrtD [Alphaproteobacteria bacterium]
MSLAANPSLNDEENFEINAWGFLLFVSITIISLPIFWYGLEHLKTAWMTPEYSHGPLIPIVSAYLFLRDMRRIPPTSIEINDRWMGVSIIIASMLLAMLGNFTKIPDFVTYGLIVWVWGMVLVCFGFKRGKYFWAGVLHLVYMLPLPNSVYWKLSTSLQLISSEVGVAIIRGLGITVFLDGNVIDLGVYQLQVAEACSGLRYLFPILSFSYIFALLYRGPRWHKIILLVAAAPITVLMNSFRIGVIGILVENYGIEQAEGFLHAFEGWVIFGACIAILLGMVVIMQRFAPNPLPLRDSIDLDFTNINQQLFRVFYIAPSKALLASGLIVSAVLSYLTFIPEQESPKLERMTFSVFPSFIETWKGKRQYLSPNVEQTLGADDYLSISYVSKNYPTPVAFFSAYYNEVVKGNGIHSPEVCIPGGGWEMSEISQKKVSLDAVPKMTSLTVNRAIIQKKLDRQLVYYWFDMRGRKMTNDYVAKALGVWDAVKIGRTDGALVRLVTPILPNEKEETADKRLKTFMELVLPKLPSYIPE